MTTSAARRNAWWVFLAVTVPVAGLYLFGPSSLNVGLVFNAIGISAVVAIVTGVRMHRPSSRGPWYLFAAGQALLVSGDVLAYNYHRFFGGTLPFPSIADPFYLAVYPAIIAGLLILIRHRNRGRDWASLIDSLIVATGLGLLSWIFLMAPYAHDATLSTSTKLVSIANPLGDTLMLSVALRLAVGRGRRGPSYNLIVAAVVAVLVTDSVYGWLLLHGGYTTGGLLDGGWIVSYLLWGAAVLWGAAALHPSMAEVSEATAERRPITRKRLIVLALATLIAPIAQMIKSTSAGGSDTVIIAAAAIVLFILVVLRMVFLIREQEAAANRERALRQAGGALVTATNSADIMRAAQEAARALTGPHARVYQVAGRAGVSVLAPQPGTARRRRGDRRCPCSTPPRGLGSVGAPHRRVAQRRCDAAGRRPLAGGLRRPAHVARRAGGRDRGGRRRPPRSGHYGDRVARAAGRTRPGQRRAHRWCRAGRGGGEVQLTGAVLLGRDPGARRRHHCQVREPFRPASPGSRRGRARRTAALGPDRGWRSVDGPGGGDAARRRSVARIGPARVSHSQPRWRVGERRDAGHQPARDAGGRRDRHEPA